MKTSFLSVWTLAIFLLAGSSAPADAKIFKKKNKKAQTEKVVKPASKDALKPYNQVITDQAKSTHGFISVHKVGNNYFLEIPEVLAVSVLRVLLTGFLFGNGMSIIYSLAGAVVSLLAMVLVKKMDGISIVGVSITGGVFHNI